MKLVREVDPFIGAMPPGNCLCGPFWPLGMARLGPDTILPQPTHGYDPGLPIRCFSYTHCSGTGGEGRYGNIALAPVPDGYAPLAGGFTKQEEEAACGYYKVRLHPGDVVVELAASRRAGLTRFSFSGSPLARVMLDVGAVIQVGFRKPVSETGGSIGGHILRVSPQAWQGYGVYQGGWGHSEPYTIHFHAELDRRPDRVWISPEGTSAPDSLEGANLAIGFDFAGGGVINFRIGLSLVSAEKARENLAREISTRSLETIRSETEEEWEKWLGRWKVEGGTVEQRKIFYTFITRLLCMPTDLGVDDENPAWRSGVRQFWDHYCLWDSYRGAQGWLALIAPELARDQLNAMVDVAQHTGWMPDAWIAGSHGMRQGGSPASILLAEAAARGMKGIDYSAALRAMIADAESVSPNEYCKGRRDLAGYRQRGRVSIREQGCVSRTLEYAWQDASIASLARHLGDEVTTARYEGYAARIWELWRKDFQALAPRDDEGAWIENYHPGRHSAEPIWHDPYFYEGLGYDWTASLLFDLPGWRQRCGGAAGLESWLDRYWRNYRKHWKEIQMHIPWLYIEAGRPDKASAVVAQMRDTQYRAEPKGLRDNEDMGAHAAFYLGAATGLYPRSGSDRWWLTAPLFRRVELQCGEEGGALVVQTDGPLGMGAKIAGAQLNGKPLLRACLTHNELQNGGLLELSTTLNDTVWGKG